MKPFGVRDDAVAEVAAAFLVAGPVQREQHLGAELAALLQHLVDQLAVDLGMRGQFGQLALRVQHFVKDELEVAQRRGVLGHVVSSVRRRDGVRRTDVVWRASARTRRELLQQAVDRAARPRQRLGAAHQARIVMQHQDDAVDAEHQVVDVGVGAQVALLDRLADGAADLALPALDHRHQFVADRPRAGRRIRWRRRSRCSRAPPRSRCAPASG